ncbi:uncharacterized protein LOC118405912 [Branchiostoma floridae]|uniref:Uncharacterized protein LOC118405912 n=2 Tax=Branchiostoma floridae TaxID=7739 RepID=A0A9J7K930_BRAFL|nr:uncharacterized protein LOC118405912 [Branchiostoma floridae]
MWLWTLALVSSVACCLLFSGVSSQTLCERLDGDSGTFNSSNYPNNYPDDHDCRYEISVTPPNVVRLTFLDFDVEDNYDYVYVYAGNTTESKFQIAKLTGSSTPGPVTSSGSVMTIRLVSDRSQNGKGFRANFTAEDKVYAACKVGQYRCDDGVTCIHAWKRCDGNNDCMDGSDEGPGNCACQDLPPLSYCRGLEYQKMTLPNPLNYNHATVAQVRNSAVFMNLTALAESDCHPRVRDLVCATILPRCETRPTLRQQLPCRSWCEEVKYSCKDQASWAVFPSCEIFPYTNCNNIQTSTTPEGAECFDGNGVNYRGNVSRDPIAKVNCEPWKDDPAHVRAHPWANLVGNKCRNPDVDEDRPWCFTPSGFEYCDIIPCQKEGCKDPGSPRGGKRSPILKFYWPGDKITYTCNPGFKLKKDSPPNTARCVVIDNVTGLADWDTPKAQCEVDQTFRLQKELLDSDVYSKAASPTNSLKIKAYVVNVINLNEKEETILASIKAEYTWTDSRLTWSSKEYGQLDSIFTLDDQVWKPTLTLERNANTDYSGGFPASEVEIKNTGGVTWPVETLTTTTCTLDPFFFPQDNMTCAVCWRAGQEYTIDCSDSTTHTDGNFLTCQIAEAKLVTGQWHGKTTLSAVNNTACLTMTLQRNPTFHYSTTISPCLILIILMIITFIMPSDKGDKIAFGVTVLLSMVVSLVVVTGFLPVSSSLPFIALLIIVCMALMGFFLMTTVFILILHDKKGPLPEWARTLFLKHLARAILMGDLTKNLEPERPSRHIVSRKVGDIEGNTNKSFKTEKDDLPKGGNNHSGFEATLSGLQGSVDELKSTVRQLSGSLSQAASGDDDTEVTEYALLADTLERLSVVLYVLAVIIAIPCTLLIGRPMVTPN